MSYCRFSSDDYQCDVYVYEDVSGGFTTHVAGGRYVFAEPLPEAISFDSKDMPAYVRKMVERGRAVSAILERSTTVAIDLPHAGESFNDGTPDACADRLESLRELGYIVPQYAIDALREEAKESEA